MTDLHDEDWFRNPRAIEQWRAEARLPPETTVPRELESLGAKNNHKCQSC
jgi:hypothetical protein